MGGALRRPSLTPFPVLTLRLVRAIAKRFYTWLGLNINLSKMSQKEVILTDKAPAPVGPYNQAIAVPATSKLVFMAGQIAIDPAIGKVVATTIEEQTEQVLKNIQAVLVEAGADFSNVVKTTVFLVDMADFAAMNAIYGKYFTAPFPARSSIQVAKLPLDVRVEIECIVAI